VRQSSAAVTSENAVESTFQILWQVMADELQRSAEVLPYEERFEHELVVRDLGRYRADLHHLAPATSARLHSVERFGLAVDHQIDQSGEGHPDDALGDVLPRHQGGGHQRLHAELRRVGVQGREESAPRVTCLEELEGLFAEGLADDEQLGRELQRSPDE
jgi:hypothetical protein